MDQISRRNFFKQAGTVAAVAGAAAVAPVGIVNAVAATSAPKERELAAEEHLAAGEHLVAHVKNADTGEISLFVGTREVTFHDRSVAARLVRASR
jgi:hypothetical protein